MMNWTTDNTNFPDETPFLAALIVHNSMSKRDYWEYTVLWTSEGVLGFYDDQADTGWMVQDYTHFAAITEPHRLNVPEKTGEQT